MVTSVKLAATLSAQDTRPSDVLRLSLVEGLSIRTIARRLQLSRKTVRRLLGRAVERTQPSSEPRASLLNLDDAETPLPPRRHPEMTASRILENRRPLDDTAGITILSDRVRCLPPHAPKEASTK